MSKTSESRTVTALILSIIPGLGEIYLNNIEKGVFFLVVGIVLFAASGLFFPIGIIAVVFWLYTIYQTYLDTR